tara:strand:- start:319 stop:561 length:243 start_codon:yes stop_codon:yes gene_type:complete
MPEENEPVVVNTGPLIALNACQQIDLLPLLHSPVIAPQEVISELEHGRNVDCVEFIIPQWLDVRSLSHPYREMNFADGAL